MILLLLLVYVSAHCPLGQMEIPDGCMPCPVYKVVDFASWTGSCGPASFLDGRQFLVFFGKLGMDETFALDTARRMFYEVGASRTLSNDVFLAAGTAVEQYVFSRWAERRHICGDLSLWLGTYATRQVAWNQALTMPSVGAAREPLPLYASGQEVVAFFEFFGNSQAIAVNNTETLAYALFLSHGFDQSALSPGGVMLRRTRLVYYLKANTTIMKGMSSAWPVPVQRYGLSYTRKAAESKVLSGQQTVHFFKQLGMNTTSAEDTTLQMYSDMYMETNLTNGARVRQRAFGKWLTMHTTSNCPTLPSAVAELRAPSLFFSAWNASRDSEEGDIVADQRHLSPMQAVALIRRVTGADEQNATLFAADAFQATWTTLGLDENFLMGAYSIEVDQFSRWALAYSNFSDAARDTMYHALITPSPAPTITPTTAPTHIITGLYDAQRNASIAHRIDGIWLTVEMGSLLSRYSLSDRRRLLNDVVSYAPSGVDWVRFAGNQFSDLAANAQYIAMSTNQSIVFNVRLLRPGYHLYHPLAVPNASISILCQNQQLLRCGRNGTQLFVDTQNVSERTYYDTACGHQHYRIYVDGGARIFEVVHDSSSSEHILFAAAVAIGLFVLLLLLAVAFFWPSSHKTL